jgi:hypothetical protein
LAVATECGTAVARVSGDLAAGIPLPDAVVAVVGDVKVSAAIHCHTRGLAQTGASRRTAVAAETRLAVSCHGGNDVVRNVHFSNPIIAGIGDVEGASFIEPYTESLLNLGADG